MITEIKAVLITKYSQKQINFCKKQQVPPNQKASCACQSRLKSPFIFVMHEQQNEQACPQNSPLSICHCNEQLFIIYLFILMLVIQRIVQNNLINHLLCTDHEMNPKYREHKKQIHTKQYYKVEQFQTKRNNKFYTFQIVLFFQVLFFSEQNYGLKNYIKHQSTENTRKHKQNQYFQLFKNTLFLQGTMINNQNTKKYMVFGGVIKNTSIQGIILFNNILLLFFFYSFFKVP
eukprot:TRINITY_DN1817_c1_g1_i12.p1 TRINITY_DN1817_c1_g1~~TRINITY_DN1817_c1_g1_i12.p1  ORF type:complete len:232 (-),score=-9.75 TRINITY_DN1817_c1_g1_i12:607-1302(-)